MPIFVRYDEELWGEAPGEPSTLCHRKLDTCVAGLMSPPFELLLYEVGRRIIVFKQNSQLEPSD